MNIEFASYFRQDWAKIICGLLIFFLFESCASDGAINSDVIKIEDVSPVVDEEWFVINDFIPLVSKDNVDYLYSFNKILRSDDGYYLLQQEGTERTIFKFSNSGKMLRSLNGQSNFEKKFYAATDIDLVDGNLTVLDRYAGELLYFDSDLYFLRSFKFDEDKKPQNVAFVTNKEIIVRPDFIENPRSSILYGYITDQLSLVRPKALSEVAGALARTVQSATFENFHQTSLDNTLLYTEFYDWRIFDVKDATIREKYTVELNDAMRYTENEMLRMKSMDSDELFEFSARVKKYKHIDYVFESKNYLFLSSIRPGERLIVIKNLTTNRVKSGVIDLRNQQYIEGRGIPPLKYLKGITDSGKLIFYFPAELFAMYGSEVREKKNTGQKLNNVENKLLHAANIMTPYCSYVLAEVTFNDKVIN
ncbi:hypothetical protein FUA23_14300 [Neolewinella aurantiaca]|uniref:6-bladed beta-propeller protein n=1 Tax=Neolewinella aurantiaca TaxID=2602767 RepID=A0A5C7FQX3_9BACT|nr:hypothetical protein [Neolewinella aurantiaca]TXF88454.1 hypothetical protein FUA23_14300 [Neolewinella aurantiaca]